MSDDNSSVSTICEQYVDSDINRKDVREFVGCRFEHFEHIKLIGRGTFGKVTLAKYLPSSRYVALKMINTLCFCKVKNFDHLQNEKTNLASISFPFIVRMFGEFDCSFHVYLVLEYVPGGDLFNLLRKESKFSEDDAKFYAAQIVFALKYLHARSIIFRDIMPENILINNDGYLKLADFGFSKKTKRANTICGNDDYMAPEILRGETYNNQVDWWALGVLIYEMCIGFPPFRDTIKVKMFENILKARYHLPYFTSKEFKSLMRRLLSVSPSSRFGNSDTDEILKEKWFKKLNCHEIFYKMRTPPFKPRIKSIEDVSNFNIVYSPLNVEAKHVEKNKLEYLRRFGSI